MDNTLYGLFKRENSASKKVRDFFEIENYRLNSAQLRSLRTRFQTTDFVYNTKVNVLTGVFTQCIYDYYFAYICHINFAEITDLIGEICEWIIFDIEGHIIPYIKEIDQPHHLLFCESFINQ